MPRVLVSGFGSIGRRHAMNALRLGWDVSIYDPVAGPTKNLFTFEHIVSKTTPDAIVLAAPPAARVSQLEFCLRNRIPVYIEKPAVSHYDQAVSLLPLLDQDSPVRTAMGYQLRCVDEISCPAPTKIDDGWATVHTIHVWCHSDITRWHPPSHPYTARIGALLEISHEIDYVCSWFPHTTPEIEYVYLAPHNPPEEMEPAAEFILRFKHVRAHFHLDYCTGRESRGFAIMAYNPKACQYFEFRKDRAEIEEAYFQAMQYFLQEKYVYLASLQEGVDVIQLIDQLKDTFYKQQKINSRIDIHPNLTNMSKELCG